jgi:hypothetical protein
MRRKTVKSDEKGNEEIIAKFHQSWVKMFTVNNKQNKFRESHPQIYHD